jgi:hypothetical protein
VGAGIERHPDGAAGELLGGVDGRVGPHHDRREGDDAAPADLAAADRGVLDPAVVAPFAGVVHVGLALLDQAAVAAERVDPLGARHQALGRLDAGLVAVGPFDREALAREQALVVGDQLGQALERRGRFEDEGLHPKSPRR